MNFLMKGFICFLLLTSVFPSFSQNLVLIQGNIADKRNNPIENLHVYVKKSVQISTLTDKNGRFELKAPEGSTIVLAGGPMISKYITLSGSYADNIKVIVENAVKPVYISAFNIKKESRNSCHTYYTVSEEEMNRGNQKTILRTLQGKSPGLYISGSGGAPGHSARVIMRGENSLNVSADNQPLIVVDGIPFNNYTDPGFGSSENFAFSNRLSDIDPMNVKSVSVMPGASASALYGFKAANGVVHITTKKGRTSKPVFQYTNRLSFEKVSKFPEQQKKYMAGWYGKPNFLSYDFPFHAYGPLGDTVQGAKFYDNLRNFFQTGAKVYNHLSMGGKTEKTSYYGAFSHSSHKGVIHKTKQQGLNIKLNLNHDITDKISLFSYNHFNLKKGNRVPEGNNSEIESGVISQLLYFPTSIDVTDYKKDDGTMKIYTPWLDHPLYVAEKHNLNDEVNRWFNTFGVRYSPLSWLQFDVKYGRDYYADIRERILPGQENISGETPLSADGETEQTKILFNHQTSYLLTTLQPGKLGRFRFKFIAGNEIQKKRYVASNILGRDFDIPGFYHIDNTSEIYVRNNTFKQRSVSFFGNVSFSWSDMVYGEITGRNDFSSTLPKQNRSFFYPSAGAAFVFSEIPFIRDNVSENFFTYGKIKASVSMVGKDAEPYRTGIYYRRHPDFPFNNQQGFTKSDNLGSGHLKPETTISKETGLELRFLQNRLTTHLTLYHSVSKDLIIDVPVSHTSGFQTFTTNSGSIENKGVECLLNFRPVNRNTISWDISVNFSKNRNKILSIADGIDRIIMPGTSYSYGGPLYVILEEGKSYGGIYGTSYKRYQLSGNPNEAFSKDAPFLIDESGFPVLDQNIKRIGNISPDWLCGIQNELRLGNFTLSFLLDIKKGGDVYNQAEAFFVAQGTSTETINRDDYIIFEGVYSNGSPNTTRVHLGQGTDPVHGINYGDGYYRNIHRKVAENFVEDASWLRLRDITLSWSPKITSQKSLFLKHIDVAVSAGNILLWTNFSGFDPESSQYGAGSNTQGFQGRVTPAVSYVSLQTSVNF
jgi:TonB-linked SusC/RagA family outer membrane protein